MPTRPSHPPLPLLPLFGLALVLAACSDGPTGPSVATVSVAPLSGQLGVGETLQLSATARDASGRVVEVDETEWTSSRPDVASISGTGLVTAVAEGSAMIRARMAGREGTANISVIVSTTPAITAVAPALLRPGDEAVIEGMHFHPSPGSNRVHLHRTPLTVLAASETSLTVRLPDFVCAPEGAAPLVVAVGGEESASFPHPFRPEGELELGVGEMARFASPDARCLLLGGAGSGREYLVGVQSTSEVVGSRTTVRLDGMRGLALAAQVAGRSLLDNGAARDATFGDALAPPETSSSAARPGWSATPRRVDGPTPAALAADGVAERLRDRWAAHRAEESTIRRAERSLLPSLEAAAGTASAPKVPSTVQAGDTVSLSIPDISTDNICQNGRSILGVVRRVGEHSIWIEDPENPTGGLSADDFELLAREFDDQIFEELTSYFGDPTDLDDNGRVVVVISREVNRMSHGVLGFVVSSDFASSCPAGNGGEYYYARAPDPSGSITGPDGETGEPYSRLDAVSLSPLLLAHEVTHIIQFGRRLQFGPGTSDEIWLLEGQATFAEEVVGHRYTGNQPGQNLSGPVAFGDYAPTSVSWYVNPFIDLAMYYGVALENGTVVRRSGAPHECTWLSVQDPEPCFSGRVAYGTTWSLLRWASDHYGSDFAGGERELHRTLIQTTARGFGALEAVLGVSKAELLAPWAASLWVDERVSGGDPRLSLPSWDLRSVETQLVSQAHLQPSQRGFTSFQETVRVAAASSYYQILTAGGASDPFAFSALTGDGEPLPAHMQVWVVRIR